LKQHTQKLNAGLGFSLLLGVAEEVGEFLNYPLRNLSSTINSYREPQQDEEVSEFRYLQVGDDCS
jgi:hypothetical protein